ncbi:MAG: NAD(P)-binding domain-containing protein [Bacillota bacterium]
MSDLLSVFIMGAGRMGEILAGSMADNHRVNLYDRDERKGREAAKRTGAGYSHPAGAIPGADAVIFALPPALTVEAVESVRKLINPKTVIINIATTVLKDQLRPVLGENEHLAGVKIVGHYREMNERPVIIVDADTEKAGQVAFKLFTEIGHVEAGDEKIVGLINTIATREAFRAAITIERLLREEGASPEGIKSALRVVASGSIKAYSENDIGPFAKELLIQINLK